MCVSLITIAVLFTTSAYRRERGVKIQLSNRAFEKVPHCMLLRARGRHGSGLIREGKKM